MKDTIDRNRAIGRAHSRTSTCVSDQPDRDDELDTFMSGLLDDMPGSAHTGCGTEHGTNANQLRSEPG